MKINKQKKTKPMIMGQEDKKAYRKQINNIRRCSNKHRRITRKRNN